MGKAITNKDGLLVYDKKFIKDRYEYWRDPPANEKELRTYTPFDNDLKLDIKTRDGYRCQMCGVHRDELIREKEQWGYSSRLCVHHIDCGVDKEGNPRQNNSPDNLITLCSKCHSNVHTERDRKRKELIEKQEWRKRGPVTPLIIKMLEEQAQHACPEASYQIRYND